MRGTRACGWVVAAPLVEGGGEVGEEFYKLWRYKYGIPEGSSEIPKGAIDGPPHRNSCGWVVWKVLIIF